MECVSGICCIRSHHFMSCHVCVVVCLDCPIAVRLLKVVIIFCDVMVLRMLLNFAIIPGSLVCETGTLCSLLSVFWNMFYSQYATLCAKKLCSKLIRFQLCRMSVLCWCRVSVLYLIYRSTLLAIQKFYFPKHNDCVTVTRPVRDIRAFFLSSCNIVQWRVLIGVWTPATVQK